MGISYCFLIEVAEGEVHEVVRYPCKYDQIVVSRRAVVINVITVSSEPEDSTPEVWLDYGWGGLCDYWWRVGVSCKS